MKKVMPYIFVALFVSLNAFAEPMSGRLPDGRAYRTAEDGSQVVDYIAELEVSVDALKRRVNGLEYELESKQKKIERLTSSGAKEKKFEERDILSTKKIEPKQDQVQSPQFVQADSSSEVQAELTDCKSQILRLEETLQSIRQQEGKQHARVLEPQEGISSKIALLESDLAAKSEEVEILTTQLTTERKKSARLLAEKKVIQEEARASLKRVSAAKPKASGLDDLRKNLLKEVAQVQSLISTRDKLFKTYHSSESSRVKFTPQKTTSIRGYSLSRIAKSLRSADSRNELNRWKRDMKEIERRMSDDIALIRRMMGKK